MENISRHGRRFKGNLGADPQKFEVGDQARSQDFASGGVTGQSIPPAGLYPGLKRPRLDFTRVHYGLGQFIPRVILSSRPIHSLRPNYTTMISIVLSDIPKNYLICQQVT